MDGVTLCCMNELNCKLKQNYYRFEALLVLKPVQEQHHCFCSLTTVSFEEEEALLSEMDVTGQAFEDMQEQNSRLLQQLREKDDANFKLMSERIKSNQIYKLLKEEKEELDDQVLTFKTQVMYPSLANRNIVFFSLCQGTLVLLFSHSPGGCPAVGCSEA